MRNKQIRKIVLGSLFAALAAVLKVSSLGNDFFRISIFNIPLLVGGYFLGPVYGLVAGFICDTTYILSPYSSATFYSLYTITTMVWGPAGALIRKISNNPSKIFGFILVITLTSIFETTFNTFNILFYAKSTDLTLILPDLIQRVTTMIVRLPIIIYSVRLIILKLNKIDELNLLVIKN